MTKHNLLKEIAATWTGLNREADSNWDAVESTLLEIINHQPGETADYLNRLIRDFGHEDVIDEISSRIDLLDEKSLRRIKMKTFKTQVVQAVIDGNLIFVSRREDGSLACFAEDNRTGKIIDPVLIPAEQWLFLADQLEN